MSPRPPFAYHEAFTEHAVARPPVSDTRHKSENSLHQAIRLGLRTNKWDVASVQLFAALHHDR